MKYGSIYKITSPSGKVYIGQTKNVKNRKATYKKCRCKKQPKVYNSILKYGWEQHIFEILENIEINNKYFDIINEREIHWIKFYDSTKTGLNIQFGGCNSPMSEETKIKLRKPKSPEHVKIMRDRMFGNQYTKGQKRSQQTKDKMSLAKQDIFFTEEWRKNMSLARLGKTFGPMSDIAKENHRKVSKKKKIFCPTNNKTYESMSDAALQLGLSTGKIAAVCKGKKEKTKDYKFNYVD